jgi:hypothetical protein
VSLLKGTHKCTEPIRGVLVQGRALDMDPFDLNMILPADESYYTYIGSLVRLQRPLLVGKAFPLSLSTYRAANLVQETRVYLSNGS